MAVTLIPPVVPVEQAILSIPLLQPVGAFCMEAANISSLPPPMAFKFFKMVSEDITPVPVFRLPPILTSGLLPPNELVIV